MSNVVITGSTKGIGKGYAREFIKRGHNIVVAGRSQADVDASIDELSKEATNGAKVIGRTCDVANLDDLQSLWDVAKTEFGSVDIWINNAGFARTGVPLLGLTSDEINAMVDANIIGTMKACQVALRGMKEQGSGFIYNTFGAGHDGRVIPGMIGYGTTKRAISYFTKSLIDEAKDTSVKIGMISPGMNITENMINQYKALPVDKRGEMTKPLNILGDYVETTTPWIVDQILSNTESGTHIKWLTGGKMFTRFISSLFNKRDLFAKYDLSD